MTNHLSRRLAPLALCALLLCSGCAILNRDNTPTLNLVEKHLVPQSKAARVAAIPLVFPLGVLAVTADAALVHPATVIDDAADDTQDILWDDWDWDTEYMTECAALPWRALFTPPCFLGDFLGRSLFDITDTADRQRDRDIASDNLRSAQILFGQGKPAEALDALSRINISRLSSEESHQAGLLRFRATIATGRYEALDNMAFQGISDTDYSAEVLPVLEKLQRSDDPYVRLHAIRSMINHNRGLNVFPFTLYQALLADPNPVVRYEGLLTVQRGQLLGARSNPRKDFLPLIEKIAAGDPDLMVRATAKETLRIATPEKMISPNYRK